MHYIDWTILAVFVLVTIFIGFYFKQKASGSTEDFFLAGRSLGWFVLGTSIVATTFSTDTPLFVARITRETGIFENWLWWSAAVGELAGVFFFAKYWRRSEVVTEVEFQVLRYGASKANNALRIFKVFFDGVFVNCGILASIVLSMSKIVTAIFDLNEEVVYAIPLFGEVSLVTLIIAILGICALVYSTMSGMYGVAYTDLIQFGLAMFGSIMLAIIVYNDASVGDGFMTKLSDTSGFKESLLRFIPSFDTFDILTFTFLVYILLSWWGSATGFGFKIQRLLAAKTEKDAIKGFFWYNIAQYVLRPWPWIIVGLFSLIYFPNLEDAEMAFPLMLNKFLPIGLKGIMVTSLLAAFMSTVDTHLNWGGSYLINDFYRPFIAKDKSVNHYVKASKATMYILTIIVLIIATQLTSILAVYKYLGLMWAGVGTVLIARWYWWRVNIKAEITAYVMSFILAPLLSFLIPNTETEDLYAVRLVVITFAVFISWLTVVFFTGDSKPKQHVIDFWKKMKVPGRGWDIISNTTSEKTTDNISLSFKGWIVSVIFIYSLLFAIGKFIFQEYLIGLAYTLLAFALAIYLKKRVVNRIF